ncbi:hypothetical protein [Clostridium sp. CTA-19]
MFNIYKNISTSLSKLIKKIR